MLSLRRVLASAIVLAVGMAGLAGISGCDQMSSRGGAFVPPADLQPVGLQQVWQRRVTLAPGEKIVNTWRLGDSIYVTTSQARVVRLNATAGTLAWELDLVNKGYRIFRPAEIPGGKNVLVVNQGQALLVDKETADVVLQKPLEIAIDTDPIVPGGNIFCIGGVNYFYALYLDTLEGKKWVTAAKNDAFIARPAVQADSVLLASENGKLWRVSLANGDPIWRDRKTNGHVVGGLAADTRAVYVPCLDGNVYAFDMTNGFQLWNRAVKGELDKALMLTSADVLVPTGPDNLYCLSSARGEIRWEAHGIKDLGTQGAGRVWVTDTSGNLKALSLDNGEVLATAPVGGASLVANPEDRLVILVTKAGVVAAYTPK